MIGLMQRLFSAECFFRTNFQIYCPGCGGSRAAIALLHGDFIQSFKYNPVTFLFLVDVLLMLLLDIAKKISHKEIVCARIRFLFNVALLVFIIAYSIFRNYLWLVHRIDLLGDFS